MHLSDAAVFDALSRSFLVTACAFQSRHLVHGEAPGLRYAAIGGTIAGFNRLMATELDERTADADVATALTALEQFPVLSAWIPPHVRPADLAERFAARGFVADDELVPAMAADLGALPQLDDLPGVTWRIAGPGSDVGVVADLMIAGFEMPPDLRPFLVDVMAGTIGNPEVPARTVIAELDGEPASTALTAVSDGVAVIYNVATVPEARGRGLGRLVTVAVLQEAHALGAGAAVLESSHMGYGLYGRLGFQDVGRYRLLVRVRSTSA